MTARSGSRRGALAAVVAVGLCLGAIGCTDSDDETRPPPDGGSRFDLIDGGFDEDLHRRASSDQEHGLDCPADDGLTSVSWTGGAVPPGPYEDREAAVVGGFDAVGDLDLDGTEVTLVSSSLTTAVWAILEDPDGDWEALLRVDETDEGFVPTEFFTCPPEA